MAKNHIGNVKNAIVTVLEECLGALPCTISFITLPMWSLHLQQPGNFTSQTSWETVGVDGHQRTSQHRQGPQACSCVTVNQSSPTEIMEQALEQTDVSSITSTASGHQALSCSVAQLAFMPKLRGRGTLGSNGHPQPPTSPVPAEGQSMFSCVISHHEQRSQSHSQ